jgi:hypothetical protein
MLTDLSDWTNNVRYGPDEVVPPKSSLTMSEVIIVEEPADPVLTGCGYFEPVFSMHDCRSHQADGNASRGALGVADTSQRICRSPYRAYAEHARTLGSRADP